MTSRLLRRALPAALTLVAVLAPGANAAVRPEVVVRFKSTASAQEVARAGQTAGFERVRRSAGGARVARLRHGVTAAQALTSLRARRSVAWAGQNLIARTASAFNDTGLARKAGLAGGWESSQWNLVGPYGIGASEAWEAVRAAGVEGGRGVKVAVLDTGAAYANRSPYRRSPELPAERLLPGYDFVSRDRFPNDANGHGTFVATSIAGAADNGYGMVGVAYTASVMPVRVLNAEGEGSSARIAEGIRWAVDHGARVLNVSIELYDPVFFRAQSITAAPEISSALRYAARRKAIVVAAAGNASQRDVPDTSQESNVIYVGGSTEHGCLGDYSNHGAGMDLVAPGGGADVNLATDPNCRRGESPGRNIQQVTFRQGRPGTFLVPNNFKGTSMAAPHVTGTVALMLAARTLGKSPTPAGVARRLKQTATDLGVAGDRRVLRLGPAQRGRRRGPAAASTLGRSHNQHGAGRVVADLVRHGAEQEALGAGHALVAHHDEVGAGLLGDVEDRVRRTALTGVDLGLHAGGAGDRGDVFEDRVDGLARRQGPAVVGLVVLAGDRRDDRAGDRLVGADDLQARPELARQLDRPAHRLARGVRAVRAHDDRVEKRHQVSFVMAMTMPASVNTTITTCIQTQNGDTPALTPSAWR